MEPKHVEIFCESVLPPLSPKQPWFVAQNLEDEGDDTQVDIFYNIHDPLSHYQCQIPELHGNRVRGCFHGCWVVLSSNHPRDVIWSLWNPITSKIINLPPLNHSGSEGDCGDIRECCLSAPPEDPNSVLLLLRTAEPNFVFCRLGIDSSSPDACLRWTDSTYANQINILTDCDGGLLRCLTCCNGKVYAYIKLSGNRPVIRLIVEVNIVINDCESKKRSEAVITLLPILEYDSSFLFIDCDSHTLFLKGSSTELFLVVLGSKDEGKTVCGVKLLKLDLNNMTWEEIEDLKDTVLSVESIYDSPMFYSPAIASSEFGGYIHILADKGKIIYSYHVEDKTISFSSIPCIAGTNHVSAWAMVECTRLESDRVLVGCKQEKEGHKEDEIVLRSVKGNHDVDSQLLNFQNGLLKEFCACVKCRKLSPLPYVGLKIDMADDDDESSLFNLPPHVLENLIMEFCAGVDYLKFRATCKRCHLAAPLIPWNNGKASKIMQNYSLPSPWLIVFDKHKGIMTLTDPMFGDKYFIKTPQQLICDFQIKCSRFGWLLILNPGGSLVFFNPFTKDILELPEFPDTYKHLFCFSAPPTSPDCMVVVTTIGSGSPYNAFIHIVGGESSWRRTPLNIRRDGLFSYITFYGRDLYALRWDGGFDIFKEFGRENQKWWCDVAKAPASCCTSEPQCFQLKCDQHILRIIVGKFGESVEVFRVTVSRKWLKVVDLRKHMIFISGASSVCLDAKTPQMANKIYFPSSPIMYYSLETCRFHTLNNEDSFGDYFGTKHHLTSHGWIEPRWS